ncbi:unnamed protein product [Pedinophyceae sp. YPF-701]|nr:unnamed protein product [Pedinophyceae sp. YPF-701]
MTLQGEVSTAAPTAPQEAPAPRKPSVRRAKPEVYIPRDVQMAAMDPKLSGSLSSVVENASKRWFYEAAEEAYRGDVKMQALLGQMLKEGYGGPQDEELGQQWADKARSRGYRMKGVYCEI